MSTDATDPTLAHPDAAAIGANDQDLAPRTVVGEYEIQAKIGEGGFGAVYKAVHPLIGKVAAVKVLSRQYSAQPAMVSRFVAEARAVNQIQNRHIIDIFAFGRLDDGRHYYVMEYLDGVPLERYIAERERLPLADSVAILRAVAKALDAAHGKGIAHRDLKPDNVFLVKNEDGTLTPKLLDFGIAKLLSDEDRSQHKTKTGAPMGTPYYMSPEQCRGRDVDHRTDIYAFGVMAYKMLTGVVPFEGDDYMSILMRQMADEARPPSSLVPDLPAGVDQCIAWMMKKSPAERPPNLVTAVRSLEQAATEAGIALPSAAPSGVYAARTTPIAYHGTPGDITPMGDATPAPPTRSSDIGLAATAAPGELEQTAADGGERAAKGTRRWAVFGLVGALLLGAGMYAFMFTRDGSDEGADADARVRRRGLVTLDIQGPPAGTEVYGPRGLLGVAPGKIQVPRRDQELILSFKAPGWQTRSIEVMPDEDRVLTVELTPITSPGSADAGVAQAAGADNAADARPAGTTGDKSDNVVAGKSKKGSGKKGSGKKGSGKKGSGKKGSGSTAGKGASDISDRDTIEDPFK